MTTWPCNNLWRNQMHIAVFTQYHSNPDCPATSRHFTFLAYLARHHRVSLITTNTWMHLRLSHHFPWVPEGVELHAFDVPYSNRMGRGQRLVSFSHFALKALQCGLSLPKPDVIWGISTPLTAAWAAAKVARRRKIPWVFEVQDLWPSFPIEMGAVPGKWLQNKLFAAEQQLYRQADHIITLSPDMVDYIRSKDIPESKISLLLNGTDLQLVASSPDPEQLNLRQQYEIGNRKVVLYAGAYGRANDIPLLVEVAKLLQGQQDICFVFTGEGYHATLLKEAAKTLTSIRIIPPQPRHRIFSWFKLASLSLVPFLDLPVLHTNSPAKLYDSLAVGTPVIVTNSGWTKTFVETNSCGWYVPAGNPPALAQKIVQALANHEELTAAGSRGKAMAFRDFDRQRQAIEMEHILQKVVKGQEVFS
jgi:glycosyltransferase involved in cell wall biosynthesis